MTPCVKNLARTVNLLVYAYAPFTAGNLVNYSFWRDFCHFVSTWTRISSLSQTELSGLLKDPNESWERQKRSSFYPLSIEAGISKVPKWIHQALTFRKSHLDLGSYGETQATWINNELPLACSEHVKMLYYHGYCTHCYKHHYKEFTTRKEAGYGYNNPVEKRPGCRRECWLLTTLICIVCPVLSASWLPEPHNTDCLCWVSADDSPYAASSDFLNLLHSVLKWKSWLQGLQHIHCSRFLPLIPWSETATGLWTSVRVR